VISGEEGVAGGSGSSSSREKGKVIGKIMMLRLKNLGLPQQAEVSIEKRFSIVGACPFLRQGRAIPAYRCARPQLRQAGIPSR